MTARDRLSAAVTIVFIVGMLLFIARQVLAL